jgi:hypothetical protein
MNASRSLLCTILGAAFAAGSAHAMTRSDSVAGHRFVTGGIGEAEIQGMKGERDQYSLWAITAAKGSGAYLADVQLRITDAKTGKVALDSRLEGPFLMVDLPQGRYRIEARYHDQVQHKTVQVGASGLRQAVFYFDAPGVDVLPSSEAQASTR